LTPSYADGFIDKIKSVFSGPQTVEATFALYTQGQESDNGADEMVTLSSFKKPRILILWAVGCGPCLQELKMFNALTPELKAKGVEVLSVLMASDWGRVVAFLTHMNRRGSGPDRRWHDVFPNLPAYYDIKGEVADSFKVERVPLLIFLDAKGQVIATHEGVREWTDAEGRLELSEAFGIDLVKDAAPAQKPIADAPAAG
jgi:thiol-disulfide isomerase/thioredoxin